MSELPGEPGLQKGSGQGSGSGQREAGKSDSLFFRSRLLTSHRKAGEQSGDQTSADPTCWVGIEGVPNAARNIDPVLELSDVHTQALACSLAPADQVRAHLGG